MKRYYSVFLLILLVVSFSKGQQNQDEDIYFDTSQAEALFDLNFTKTERDSIQDGLKSNLKRIKALHAFSLENETPPAFIFNPLPVGFKIDDVQKALNFGLPVEVHQHRKLRYRIKCQFRVIFRQVHFHRQPEIQRFLHIINLKSNR